MVLTRTAPKPMNDTFSRQVDYLRLSITDRCNEKCLYCMPQGYKGWQLKQDPLEARDFVRICQVAADLGFTKFRLTGGEPLLRKDVVEIATGIRAVPGVQTLGISTNGTRLSRLASDLHHAGVQSLNISLDALDPLIYHQITGGDVASVLAGIEGALKTGLGRIKLNCVLMRDVNEGELWPLAQYAARLGLPLRFIELMPLTSREVLSSRKFMSIHDAMCLLQAKDALLPEPGARLGNGPAVYYRLQNTGGIVGFIGAMTNLHFCDACNKMRITADGKIRPCLGDHGEIDLQAALKEDSNAGLRDKFLDALRLKPKEHLFRSEYLPQRPMTAIGG